MKLSLRTQKIDYRLSAVILIAAFAFLYLVGIQGVMKSNPFGDDFAVLYRAGSLFLAGIDPWLELMTSTKPYSYPPHSISIMAFYNLLPLPVAVKFHALLIIVSIVAICFCANKWFLKIDNFKNMTVPQLFSLAIVIGNPYMATSIHQGQMTLPATAAVLLSWYFVQHKRLFLAGLFLGFATIKPQLSILYVLWLVFSLNFRVLLVGGVLALTLIIPGAYMFGVLTPFKSWITSMSGYSSIPINAPGAPYVVGFESLLAAYGIKGTGILFKPMAFIAIVVLFLKRKALDDILIVHMFMVLTFTFVYGHDYDYAAIVVIWSYGLFLALSDDKLNKTIPFFILMFFFFLPQRILRDIDIPLIVHARTIILLICCYLVYSWTTNKRNQRLNTS